MKPLQYQDIFKKFDELSNILQVLKKKGNLSLLERDLMLGLLRKMYSLSSAEILIDTEHEITRITEETVQEIEKTEVESHEIKNKVEEEPTAESYEIKNEKLEEKAVTEIREPQKTDIPEFKETKGVLGEKYQGSKEFINEHISKQRSANDISVKLHSKPVDDIAKAIGLNEKFLYINELFNGDAVHYKKTLEFLNNCKDFNEAFSFIENNFNWDMNRTEVQNFLDIVKRKYISAAK